jgi:hypothetical protein
VSIMPLTDARVQAHDEGVPKNPQSRTSSHDIRPWSRLLARLLAPSLDRQLARGCSPASSRHLALRAQELVSQAGRRELAHDWDHVLEAARRSPAPRSPRLGLCRDRVIDAEDEVKAMLAVLADPLPIATRGAAMASQLLSDGTGPLCNRRSPVDLRAAVRETARLMDPFAGTALEAADSVRPQSGCPAL